jgi:mRNA interferase MazF
LGANIGFEENGKHANYERPVLILKKFNKDMLWVVPLTSQRKSGLFYYDLSIAGFNSMVIISQLRLISSKRLIRKLGVLPTSNFLKVKEAVVKLL